MGTTKVQVYVYELTNGMARAMSRSLLGIEVEGVWHTGIVAYNQEYFFGSHGISSVLPGGVIGQPTEIVDIGETEIPIELFEEFLLELANDRFHGTKYHLLEHNCNNFSNEVAQFLTGNPIPAKIVNLPSEVMKTPFGQMIRPFIESMMGQVNGMGQFQPHQQPSTLLSAQAPILPQPSTIPQLSNILQPPSIPQPLTIPQPSIIPQPSAAGSIAQPSSSSTPATSTTHSKSDAAPSDSSHHDFDLD
uniref:PPPDE domain-containing protein n=1 Tax=Plectus sambesii TaxID=2011161 RepID=A0A914XQC9_9BILA